MELKRIIFFVVVAVGALAVATDAQAFWGRRHGSSGGSWGSSGGSWGSSGGSWGSSGGSWGSRGSHGGWFRRGSWGSCGSSGGSWGGSHGSSGGSAGGSAYVVGNYGEVYASNTRSNSTIQTAEPTATTRLTLHVPENATVTLAGVETKQTGETRQFSTTRLAPGQTWDDYKVVVQVERNGHMQTEERVISLQGGQSQELSIDVGHTPIAKL